MIDFKSQCLLCSKAWFLLLSSSMTSLKDDLYLNNDEGSSVPIMYYSVWNERFFPAFDLDVVKLTAQFVARNGRQFLTNLMNREQRNYQASLIFITFSYLWTTTTCQQQPQIWGPEGCCCTQVWQYFQLWWKKRIIEILLVWLPAASAFPVPVLYQALGAVHEGLDPAQGCHEKTGGRKQERKSHQGTCKFIKLFLFHFSL